MSSKSDSVQFRYREFSLDQELLNGFANEDLGALAPERVPDEVQELFTTLFGRLMWIIENKLTARQTQIVKMIFLEQKTQTEVARILGLCQPSVHKSLLGNLDYTKNQKRYGGAVKKIKKLASEDPEIQEALKRLEEFRRENS